MDGTTEAIFAVPEWTPSRRAWARGLSLFFAVLFLVGVVAIWGRYPDEFYSWTELLISYAGGFMRRGLLGEMAWQARSVVEPRLLLSVLVWCAYTGVAIWFVRLVMGRPSLSSLMFLFSPALLLLPLYDFEAFARKDAFIVLAFCLSISAARRFSSIALALLATFFAFSVAGLIHELAYFYLPLALVPCALRLYRVHGTRAIMLLAGATLVYLIAMIGLAMIFRGQVAQGEAIIAAWRQLDPGAFSEWAGAFGFIGNGLGEGLALQSFFLGRFQAWGGYIVAFFLALLPLFMYLPGRALERHFDHRLLRLGLLLAILTALMPFVIAGDWGRIVNMFVLCLGAVILSLRPTQASADPEAWWHSSASTRWAGWALVGLYALTWRMRHSAPSDPALTQGTLFLIFDI
jgi:hypothetical protein